ncbi:cytoplasmic protein [Roridomyces roridus]|uniref:Cytoplasmic protein n=1 Tax=Roridomyces roridus TaxID=1738132 RepID=A0AAD7B4N0_9AGAR|nr:cytoplasmic protein [Roridomyces roridus]
MHLLRSLLFLGVAFTASTLGDGHGPDHPGGAPKLELNETAWALKHGLTPPSYYTADWEDATLAAERHPGLMIAHGLFMCLAFFVFLPMGMALRSVKHRMHRLAVLAQWICTIVSLAYASVYRKLTPNMYPGQAHSKHGYVVLLIALGITSIDTAALLRRVFCFVRAGPFTFRGFFDVLRGAHRASESEYIGLMDEEDQVKSVDSSEPEYAHSNGSSECDIGSDDTLHDAYIQRRTPRSRLHRVLKAAFITVEWSLLFCGCSTLFSGIAVYTGGCRDKILSGCLGHLIKAGIFWSYGLLNFARFLGFGAGMGWAWNRAPSPGYPTAEFVESLVIFLYGITNTWMERIGSAPGSPYSTKTVQHIGIAVMFWFGGLLGMAIESKRLRRWFAAHALDTPDSESHLGSESHTVSFNPFPALVIGVTGAVMAAHHQEYLFQVQIHVLWGNLILAFAVMRCVTYLFLWISPSGATRSTAPSRPPSEALASFFLAAGGITFIFSTEEVTVAAMRRGRDDIMLFVVLGVSVTCIAFVWVVGVVGFQGWLRMGMRMRAKAGF